MKKYIQPGDTLTVAAPATVSSGEGVLVGALFGIAVTDAGSGEDVQIKTTGVFEVAKNSAEAWAVGDEIFWDDANTRCTVTQGTGDLFVGVATAVAANPSSTGQLRLNGVPLTAV